MTPKAAIMIIWLKSMTVNPEYVKALAISNKIIAITKAPTPEINDDLRGKNFCPFK